MKKSFLLIAIMFLIFFINKAVVNAESFIYVNVYNSSNNETGNVNPALITLNANSQATSNFKVGVLDPDHSTDPKFNAGDRFLVNSNWCVQYSWGNWSISQVTQGLNLHVNNTLLTFKKESCQFTDSSGNVFVGNGILSLDVDFTIQKSALNPNVTFLLQQRNSSGNLASTNIAFLNYNIMVGEQITAYENSQNIINNDNSNTQDIIDNQNANTDRIVNAQNGTTNAVNGLNNSVNDTSTTGSESLLTSIINDPAFQDNTGINGIIQLPLAMISSLSSQCSPVDIYIPFLNVNTQLPCISSLINQKMPAVANILRIAVNGFVLYRIFIDIVGLVKSARNPDEDRLDVLEL